jgi:hypothetical protein
MQAASASVLALSSPAIHNLTLQLPQHSPTPPASTRIPILVSTVMSASEAQETMCAALLGSADEYLVSWAELGPRMPGAGEGQRDAIRRVIEQSVPLSARDVTAQMGRASGLCLSFLLPGTRRSVAMVGRTSLTFARGPLADALFLASLRSSR